jgi:GNAT superfamily N-acetyltransferase
MIREAERTDKEKLFELYRMLVPNSKKKNIIVHENHRSKNIGQKLLQYVENYCRTLNCHRIMLLSHSTRERAHQFFEREGYDGLVSKGFKKYL